MNKTDFNTTKLSKWAPRHRVCNICQSRPAVLDTPTYDGPWAHLCIYCASQPYALPQDWHSLAVRILDVDADAAFDLTLPTTPTNSVHTTNEDNAAN